MTIFILDLILQSEDVEGQILLLKFVVLCPQCFVKDEGPFMFGFVEHKMLEILC